MHFSSYKSSHLMEEDEMCSNVALERPVADFGCTSLSISGTYADHLRTAFELNNQQNQIMSGYPVFSGLQGGGEPICHLLAGAHISTHPPDSDAYISRIVHSRSAGVGDATLSGPRQDVCEQFEEGTLVPATVLAGLLASRGCLYQNVDDPTMCGSGNLKALAYNDDPGQAWTVTPGTSFDQKYDSQMRGDTGSDVWVDQPPHPVFYGGFDSHSAEKGYYQDTWAATQSANLAATYPYNPAMFNNELSLSLASSQLSPICQPSVQDPSSEFNLSRISNRHESGRGSEQSSSAKTNDHGRSLTYPARRTSQPSPALSGSSYLKAVQQILADLASFSLENVDLGSYSASSPGNVASISGEYSESDGSEPRAATLSLQKQEVRDKKKQLQALLKMADEGYNQCVKEVHSVMSSFHPITGLDPDVHVRFVLQTTLFLYKSLKERIGAQILNMKASMQSDATREQERAFESSFLHKQWALQQLRRKEHHLWRPQRGLPERCVSVLRAWMFQNFLHPYPKDSEKHMLALKSGLTRSQVSNWFINARVRLWKPMIEEMYAEINRRKTHWKGHAAENSVRGHSSVENQRFQCD